jgi:nucleotide-binding universal stress UspA family protein
MWLIPHVVAANDSQQSNPIARIIQPLNEFVNEVNEDGRAQTEKVAADAVEELRAALSGKNITVSTAIETANPQDLLVRYAADFGADCIFIGANGLGNSLKHFVLGSVSASVAERAACSVEVVRAG